MYIWHEVCYDVQLVIARQVLWLENTTQYYGLFLGPWVYDTNVPAVCPFRPSVSKQLKVQLETLKGFSQMHETNSTVRSSNGLFMIRPQPQFRSHLRQPKGAWLWPHSLTPTMVSSYRDIYNSISAYTSALNPNQSSINSEDSGLLQTCLFLIELYRAFKRRCPERFCRSLGSNQR